MKFVALVSGGKDSCYNIMHCLVQGHELVALANLHPADESRQELDSFMYQTVGHDVLSHYSECCEVPMYRQAINGTSKNQKLEYSETVDDETEDLYLLLRQVLDHHPDVEGVSVGAILSSYQRTRVEHVCQRLGLTSLLFLWQRDQLQLLTEMSMSGMDARIIKVAAVGLNTSHLTKSILEMLPVMKRLNEMYEVHICGEGGEFETLVLDAPFFKRNKLQIVDQHIFSDSADVSYVKLQVKVVPKEFQEIDWKDNRDLVVVPPMLTEDFQLIYDQLDPISDSDVDKIGSQNANQRPTLKGVQMSKVKLLGNRLFVSNLTCPNESSVENQTIDIFAQLSELLTDQSLTFESIQSCQLLIASMSDFGLVNNVYKRFFEKPLPPARICVETVLPEGILVQLSVTALTDLKFKRGVHIQGRSYWAPANIGPYSQSIVDMESQVAAISGQIPLVPLTMDLCPDLALSSVLSLQHFDSVKNIVNITQTLSTVAFIVDEAFLSTVLKTWDEYDHKDLKKLIVVQVTALPRNAKVEWGGLAYKEIVLSDSEDEDEATESLTTTEPEQSLSKVNGKYFDNYFFNKTDFKNLSSLVRKMERKSHFVIYCDPATVRDEQLQSLFNNEDVSLELVPTLNVWDHEGHKYDLLVVIRSV